MKFTTFNPADWLRTEEAREYFLQDAEATGEPEYIEQAKTVVEKSRELFPISLLLEDRPKG
jgi:DNA-binding phage protein